jgi:hypothetical protein
MGQCPSARHTRYHIHHDLLLVKHDLVQVPVEVGAHNQTRAAVVEVARFDNEYGVVQTNGSDVLDSHLWPWVVNISNNIPELLPSRYSTYRSHIK